MLQSVILIHNCHSQTMKFLYARQTRNQNSVKEYGMWWRGLSQMTITCNKILELYDIRIWLCINLLVVYPGPESNRHACLGRGILSPE